MSEVQKKSTKPAKHVTGKTDTEKPAISSKKEVKEIKEVDKKTEVDVQKSTDELDEVSEVEIMENIVRKDLASWYKDTEEFENMSLDDVYKMYLDTLPSEREKNPGLSTRVLYRRALNLFKSEHKISSSSSNAVPAKGIIYGTKGSFDTIRKRRAEAIALAELNPKKAIKLGIVMVKDGKIVKDKDGNAIPIENRKVYDGYYKDGKPLLVPAHKQGKELAKHRYINLYIGMLAVGRGTPDKPIKPSLVFYQLRGKLGAPGALKVPLMEPIEFVVFDNKEKDEATGLKIVNGFKTKFTKYYKKDTKGAIIKDDDGNPVLVDVPSLYDLYAKGVLNDFKIELANVEQWIDKHSSNKEYNSFFVAEVNVLEKSVEPNSNRSYRMQIDDSSFADASEKLGYKSLTSFVPIELKKIYETFGESSVLIIIASASKSFKKDENGEYERDAEGNRIKAPPVVNIWCIDIHPDYFQKPQDVDEMSDEDDESDAGIENDADSEIAEIEEVEVEDEVSVPPSKTVTRDKTKAKKQANDDAEEMDDDIVEKIADQIEKEMEYGDDESDVIESNDEGDEE